MVVTTRDEGKLRGEANMQRASGLPATSLRSALAAGTCTKGMYFVCFVLY